MKKIILGLAAVAALSTAALASERTDIDPRDRLPAASVGDTAAIAAPVLVNGGKASAWLDDRRLDEKNEHSNGYGS
jgi:hypothetical protein